MRFSTLSTIALAAAASAQTFTDCDPTKKSCPNDVGLPASTFSSDFTSGDTANASWSAAAYSTISYGANGAEFSIANANQAPTIETDFNIFFGRIDIKMKAAKGQGIVSSIVLESDDLDEIDWEFIGSDNTQVQSNFYGKGNTTTYDRVVYIPVTTPTDLFHTYSIDWTSERLQFLVDGVLVRTVEYSDPKALYGKNYPQTPAKLKLGNWCGGCGKNEGTVEWAGGKASFGGDPYVMYVESVNIKNYNPADAYKWTDESGSWESIKLINDGSASQPSGGSNGGQSATGASTSAPTASHSVGNIHLSHTPSVTQTGMPYSMNSASAIAQNSGKPTAGAGAGNTSGSEGGSGGAGSSNGGHGASGSDSGSMSDDCTTATAGGSGTSAASTMTSVIVVAPTGGSAGSTTTSITVVGPTAVSGGSYPTGSSPASGAGSGSNGTVSSPTPSGPAQQTGNAASSLTVASGSLLGLVFSLLFL